MRKGDATEGTSWNQATIPGGARTYAYLGLRGVFPSTTFAGPVRERAAMFLMLSKKPRRTNRTKSKRYRSKLKAKNRNRRNRVYQRG